jgi:hypothetical protein
MRLCAAGTGRDRIPRSNDDSPFQKDLWSLPSRIAVLEPRLGQPALEVIIPIALGRSLDKTSADPKHSAYDREGEEVGSRKTNKKG